MLLLEHGRGPAASIAFTVIMFFLFCYLILNIVIAITEHSYFSSRVRRRYLEVLIENGMLEAMNVNDTSMRSDLLPTSNQRQPQNVQKSSVAEELRAVENFEDSYGDGGFSAVNEGLMDLLATNQESQTLQQQHPLQERAESTEYEALRLSKEDRDAEMHILGIYHWDYSKVSSFGFFVCLLVLVLFNCLAQMIDFLAACYSTEARSRST